MLQDLMHSKSQLGWAKSVAAHVTEELEEEELFVERNALLRKFRNKKGSHKYKRSIEVEERQREMYSWARSEMSGNTLEW